MRTRSYEPSATRRVATRADRGTGLALGLLATGAGLAASELVNGLYDSGRSPVVSAGEAFIDRTPPTLKDWAIRNFGTSDKMVLVTGALAVITLLGVVVGRIAVRRRVSLAGALTLVIGVLGAMAVVSRPNTSFSSLGPTVAGTVVSLGVLAWYWRGPGAVSGAAADDPGDVMAPLDRRRFVAGAAAITASALAAAGTGQVLGRRFGVASERDELVLPAPDDAAGALPVADDAPGRLPPRGDATGTLPGRDDARGPLPGRDDAAGTLPGPDDTLAGGVEVGVPGVSPFVTSNAEFYRIDTALTVPQLKAAEWQLRVHGMVDRELTLNFADLLARPQVERFLTLSCVSNEVGGQLVGNALWQGALLGPILTQAGVQAGAEQLVSRSVDGWTCGTPVAEVMDGRDALLAVRMNGEPLPTSHGYPVRMVVPGMYGFVSATKWVVEMELTTWDAFDAYWVPRGWSQQAPFKMTSRIDTPRSGANLAAGRQAIAGLAWHPHVGVAKVEVQIDGGDWRQAQLADVPSKDTWRQWVYPWDAEPGNHTIRVRAINEAGEVQVYKEASVAPDGASGYHEIDVRVSR
ncbi:MAG: molybdopterin-dependent oxidoreductase [Acidimicrobiia bacterium]|nr:molybdopterin-dependent oxidoreductase [Acidimicrobiia bacterium]